VRELVDGHPTLVTVAAALLAALQRQFKELEERIVAIGRADARVRRLVTVPGVGNLVALTFTTAIDDPARFRSSRQVGANFGLTPSRYQPGETDITGRISKIGDHGVRTVL
jgi:transposase